MTTDTLAKLAADNVPERIYLVLGEDIAPDDDPRADFDDLADVNWCIDKQFEHDIEYVRADVAALTAQALPAAEPWNAQPFNAPVYPPDGTKSPFTVINLGLGKVQMGDSIHDHRLPALWFGTNGQGMGHEEIMNREAKPGETLAVVTFANVEGLDVLLEAVQRIRRESFPQAAQQAAQAPAGWASAASKAIEVLTTTAGNIRSLGPAGALEPWDNYLVWLDVVEKAAADLANAPPQPQEDAA